jgi:hypothetical protein
MSKEIEKRLSRIEKRLAERTREHSICNCRVETRFHNGPCVAAILKGASRVCPVHGFRDFGLFAYVARSYLVNAEDNRFCPCPPDPWRSFLLSEGPHTWEGNYAAREACRKLPISDDSNRSEDNGKLDEVFGEYSKARRQWVDSGGRLPDREEIKKLAWKRARKRGRGR